MSFLILYIQVFDLDVSVCGVRNCVLHFDDCNDDDNKI